MDVIGLAKHIYTQNIILEIMKQFIHFMSHFMVTLFEVGLTAPTNRKLLIMLIYSYRRTLPTVKTSMHNVLPMCQNIFSHFGWNHDNVAVACRLMSF